MVPDGNMEYALARVQAQYGERPDASHWRRLEAAHDLGQYLDAARASKLADWVAGLDRTRDAHAIERSLRVAWRLYAGRVARWHPARWGPWLGWLEWLPSLSLLAALARPEPVPAWLLADPLCGPIAPGALSERIAALKGTPMAPFEPAISGRVGIAELWRSRWDALRPPLDAHTAQLLAQLSRALRSYVHRIAESSVDSDSAALRAQLIERLTKTFRAAAGTVIASVCHLSLTAFDFERLRGGLVKRALLGPPEAL
jgi:hypothetical protein